MNREQFLAYHKDFCRRMKKTVARKNADYCSQSEFAFENFCQVEVDGLCSTEVGMWTRFRDKTSRLLSFLKGNVLQVKDEKIEDTILDACNYLILLGAYLKYKRSLGTIKTEFESPEATNPWECSEQTVRMNIPGLGMTTINYGSTQ